jgi:hypothetical protein
MAHRAWLHLRIVLGVAAATASWTACPVVAQVTDAIDAHVALSVKLLELSVAEWQERAAVPAAADPADPARAAALADIARRFKAERDRVYRESGTTAADVVVFAAKHAADVDDHLAANPEIKGHIDALNQTLRSLTGIEESKAAPAAGANR